MKTKNHALATQKNLYQRLSIWAVIVAAILMIPVVGRWPWTGSDFVFGAVMLFGSATVFEVLTQKMKNPMHRYSTGAAIFMVLATIWVILATG